MPDPQLAPLSSIAAKPANIPHASGADSPESSKARGEWILLHVGFVAVGIITTLIGNVLPSFIHHWSLSDSQAGFLIAAQFSGNTVGTLLTSLLLPRFGFARVLGAGYLLFAMGFSFLGLGPWFISALAIFVYGFGYGLVNPATNLRGTQLPSKNVASAVSFLNFSWTVGAVSCPFVGGHLLPWIGIRGIALSLTVITCVLAAFHLARYFRSPEPTYERSTQSGVSWMRELLQGRSLSLLLIFFLYVGTEVGVGNWVATQEKRLPGGATATLLLAPSFFYLFLLLGRAVSPLLLRRFSTFSISFAGLVSAALGTLIIILAHQPHWLFLGAALAGLGCAPQYPIFVTWLAQTFDKDSASLSSVAFATGGAGGALLPWLMGFVGAQTDSLRLGFIVPLVASLLMMFFARRSYPRPQAA
jgi:MFS transporter, FHS family, glucose/mannose:H+ symporter